MNPVWQANMYAEIHIDLRRKICPTCKECAVLAVNAHYKSSLPIVA